MSKSKPFFSVIIPCYNDGRYAPGQYIDALLSNLVKQKVAKSKLEVILVDDCSPIPYDGTVEQYAEVLTIKRVTTESNCGPGGCRQLGTEVATGEWLCFADHDDLFYPKALARIKKLIEETKEQNIVYSAFNKVDFQDHQKVVEEFRTVEQLHNWVHGKFYNRENFWNKYHIHFMQGLRTHEDIALGNTIRFALRGTGLASVTYTEDPVYMWTFNPRSVSHGTYVAERGKNGDIHSFLETHFDDYITANIRTALDAFDNKYISRDQTVLFCIVQICGLYIEMKRFRQQNPEHYLKVNDAYCSKIWHEFEKKVNINLTHAKVIAGSQLAPQLKAIEAQASKIPDTPWANLSEWLTYLNHFDYVSLLDEEDVRKEEQRKKDLAKFVANRPFFSVIIPCYNDGRYAEGNYLDRLLSSLCRQGIEMRDLEVIISDDHSLVNYDWIVDKYSEKLIIKRIQTDYNFAPGNTRAKGLTIATGQWLAFADHDDIYYDNALARVKDGIEKKKEQYFAFGDFNGVDREGNVLRKFECTLNWCHAKFYNKDNLWDAQGIHFIKDLKSHEDIAICTQVQCAIEALGLKNYTYFHFPVYAWTDNPQSVSHAKYTVATEADPREFLEVFFDDYIHATGYIYLQEFKAHRIKMIQAVQGVIEIMIYCYFYMQGFQFRRPKDYYAGNWDVVERYVKECMQTFNLTTDSIYSVVSDQEASMYYKIRKLADPGSGRYIPTQTFKQWLDRVCTKP